MEQKSISYVIFSYLQCVNLNNSNKSFSKPSIEYKIHPISIDDKNKIESIKNNIRNFGILSKENLQYMLMLELPVSEKNDILKIYNNCMITLNDIGWNIVVEKES